VTGGQVYSRNRPQTLDIRHFGATANLLYETNYAAHELPMTRLIRAGTY
jgi:hypothetical protein